MQHTGGQHPVISGFGTAQGDRPDTGRNAAIVEPLCFRKLKYVAFSIPEALSRHDSHLWINGPVPSGEQPQGTDLA
jgi:hypothetical protein